MRIVESEWSRKPKEGISVADVVQGAKDFKLDFELTRTFAHGDMFEGYRATRKYGYRGKASSSDGYKPPFRIDIGHYYYLLEFQMSRLVAAECGLQVIVPI